MINQQRILAELRRQGLVHITHHDEGFHFTITPAGVHRLQRLIIDDISIEYPKKWDKKWRMVIFDIPVRYSKHRSAFTERLRGFNFMMIQKSVWVHPAPCFEELEQLANYYNVMRYCSFLEVARMDDLSTKKLLRHFKNLST